MFVRKNFNFLEMYLQGPGTAVYTADDNVIGQLTFQ